MLAIHLVQMMATPARAPREATTSSSRHKNHLILIRSVRIRHQPVYSPSVHSAASTYVHVAPHQLRNQLLLALTCSVSLQKQKYQPTPSRLQLLPGRPLSTWMTFARRHWSWTILLLERSNERARRSCHLLR